MSQGFDRLLAALDADRDNAGEEYERIRQRLTRLFVWRGAANADELADRTMERVAHRLDEGAEIYASNPYAFFHGVALMVLRESWRDTARTAAAAPDLAAQAVAPADSEQAADRERRLACLERCLSKLTPAARELLRAYHGQEGTAIAARRQLAHALSLPLSALRLRVHRLRLGLRDCVEQCLARTAVE